MPGSVTPKDLRTLSNAILDGSMSTDNLPKNAQAALMNYWTQQGVNSSGDIDSNQSQAQLNQLISQRRAQEGGSGLASVFNSPIFQPIEFLGSKAYWLYSNTVAPTISAIAIGAHGDIYGDQDKINGWSASSFGKLWNEAHNVSPGQAIWMLGLNNKELNERGIDPAQITQDKKAIMAGTYVGAKTKADPLGNIPDYEQYFGQGAAKWATGATDFALSWYADPTVLAGKAAKIGKAVAFTKPVNIATGAEGSLARTAFSKVTGKTPSFDSMVQGSTFQKMIDTTWSIKKANPDAAALALRTRLKFVSRSANADAFTRLLAQAKTKDEISDVLRITTGDETAKATLDATNAQLGLQVKQLTKSRTSIGLNYHSLPDAAKNTAVGQQIKQHLDDLTQQLAHANSEQNILTDKLNAFNTMDNLNFNRVTSPIRAKMSLSDAVARPLMVKNPVKAVANLAYNASIAMPVKIIRTVKDVQPTMHIDIHDEDSYKQLESSLRESKTIPRADRDLYVSNYIGAAPEDRAQTLINMEHDATQKMVARYNEGKAPEDQITEDQATQIYKDFAARRKGMQQGAASGRTYGNAKIDDPNNPGMQVRVADVSPDGTATIPSPIFDTQLANNHIIMDFGTMDKALNAHGDTWAKNYAYFGNKWTQASAVASNLNSIWQFAQLARFGYGPRALSDDFMGQLARFGGMQMANRVIQGGKIKAEDWYHGKWASDDVEAAKNQSALLEQQLRELGPQETEAKNALLNAKAATAGNKINPNIPRLQQQLDDVQNKIVEARNDHLKASKMAIAGQQTRDAKIGRQVFSGPMAGQEGGLFKDFAAGGRNISAIMGSSADWYLKRMRSMNWENISPSTHGDAVHMDAWVRVLNDQVAKSPLGRQALMGKSEAEITHWLKTDAQGQKIASSLGTYKNPEHIARDAWYETNYLANPAADGMDIIRQQLLDGKLDKDLLAQTVRPVHRPDVQAERVKYAFQDSAVGKLLDFTMTGFYHHMSEVPANKLLRNPLFGQQYKVHLSTVLKRMESQGVTHVDEATRLRMENTARRLALRDVKQFTFSMDNETKLVHAMKNYGAFFGAQMENWNRWGRIIADDPSVLAHVTQAYQAPLRAGIVVDSNGNPVDASGYSTDPLTGEKKLTSFADRSMIMQVPSYLGGKWFNKFIGLDPNASFKVPMSTVNLILNKGDGALPVGAGPYIQIAANHFAKNDPQIADFMQKMGVLPFGAQGSIWDFINPATGKRLADSQDEQSMTKQQLILYMAQAETFKHSHGGRQYQPNWKELDTRANHFMAFRTIAAFGLPISVNAQDPYQFFRDEYKRLQDIDPDTADQKFDDKFGDSAFVFTQSLNKNNAGLQPTVNGVKMSKYYQDLTDKVGPQYAGLIVGDEGNGSYSNGAYFYEQTHTAAAGSTTTDRSKMDARAAYKASQVNLGWMQYSKMMDKVNSQLFDRGLKSYDDPGAEDLKALRQGTIKALTNPISPDGSKNPYYNEAWDEAYNTLSPTKYERTAVDLQKIVDDPELWSKAYDQKTGTVGIRSDIFTLKTYLDQRANMQKALAMRKMQGGSDNITASSNYDLKNSFATFTTALIEADTKFNALHSRYFANDMGYNEDSVISASQQTQLQQAGATLVGEQSDDSGQQMLDALMQGAPNGGQ